MSAADSSQWYWCLQHDTPEQAGEGCASDRRLGPYRSREEAVRWKETVDARNEEWEEEDREWEGDDAG